MKLCKNCKWKHEDSVVNAHNEIQAQWMCSNAECCDPITGVYLPCVFVRKDPSFCGIQGKHWAEAPKVTEERPDNIIQLGD